MHTEREKEKERRRERKREKERERERERERETLHAFRLIFEVLSSNFTLSKGLFSRR